MYTLPTGGVSAKNSDNPLPDVGHGRKDKGLIMSRKTSFRKRETYIYKDANEKKYVLREGDSAPTDNKPITKEWILWLHMDDDRIVENDNRNCKPKRTKKEKEAIRKWEAAHPGEEYPKNYHQSLEHDFGDENNDISCSRDLYHAYMRMHTVPPTVETLYEILDEVSEELRVAFIMVKIQGHLLKEVAEELGCHVSTVSRRVDAVMRIIEENEARFNFR